MKKLLLLSLILLSTSIAQAVERGSRASQSVVLDTGSNLFFTKNTVVAGTVIVLSTGTAVRSHVLCRNAGSFAVYIGTFSTVAAAGASSFYMGESTSTLHTFETYNTNSIYAIGLGSASGSTLVYCQEDR